MALTHRLDGPGCQNSGLRRATGHRVRFYDLGFTACQGFGIQPPSLSLSRCLLVNSI